MNLSLGTKALIVTICALLSIIVGIVAGLLSHSPGSPINAALLYGGGAFVGFMTLCMVVLSSLGVL